MENLTPDQKNYVNIRLEFLNDCLHFIKAQKDKKYKCQVEMEQTEIENEINLMHSIFPL